MVKYKAPCNPKEGWAEMVMGAALRNNPWWNIASELIDNALANKREGSACNVVLRWDTKGTKRFSVTDDGHSGANIPAFLTPGESGGNLHSLGNSTFGTGLFACECQLNGTIHIVADPDDGLVRCGMRTIRSGLEAEIEEFPVSRDLRIEFGIPDHGGTIITFKNQQKRGPDARGIDRICSEIARSYSRAMESGDLTVVVSLNGKERIVSPVNRPEVVELFSRSVEAGGHVFEVEWGVTVRPSNEAGCGLIYGGKLFERTAEPCGDYRLGRFYASIKVPRSAGRDNMDFLKRSIEQDFMDDLYEECFRLFEPQLKESDELCGSETDRALNGLISSLLTKPSPAPDQESEGGDCDKRKSEGRDPNGEGVKPKNTGRKRRGRKGSKKLPSSLVVDWMELGEQRALAEFDASSNRLTYNKSNVLMSQWKDEMKAVRLAIVGAAQIAHSFSQNPQLLMFGLPDGKFDDHFKELVKRAAEGE